jgi:murein DD-endopeptidase MepM/ murein hydrolase activator NlpD
MTFLYQPLNPFIVFQKFGENAACSNPDKTGVVSQLPDGTCPAGKVKLYPLFGVQGHTGIDCIAKKWQPVYASADGFVEELQTEEARGLGVGIITDQKYFCTETGKEEYFKYRNWHFISMDVEKGDKVKIGDFLGYADSTGYSSGDHLHFELKPVAQNSNGVWYNILQSNGYFGSVDPIPYMFDHLALKYSLLKQLAELYARLLDLLADKARGK